MASSGTMPIKAEAIPPKSYLSTTPTDHSNSVNTSEAQPAGLTPRALVSNARSISLKHYGGFELTMLPSGSSHSSPKRKRDEQTTPKKSSIEYSSTSITAASLVDDESGAESPRTQVSNRFESLHLEPSAISKLSFGREIPQLDGGMDEMDKVRKRPKITKFQVGNDLEIPETPARSGDCLSSDSQQDRGQSTISDAQTHHSPKLDPVVFKGIPSHETSTGQLSKSYPSINRLSDSKSRKKKPFRVSPHTYQPNDSSSTLLENIDMDTDRASLTWHDDELTVFDPDDPDDDGEGIDGVGFRPTAARADARQLKKKRQLEEWRNRENREARAKRLEKRTTSLTIVASDAKDDVDGSRRVRFSESDTNAMIIT